MKVKIRNKMGTAGDVLPSGTSWIDAYSQEHQLPSRCPVCDSLADLQGAHVIRDGLLYNDVVYIAPLCSACNNPNNTHWMEIDERLLVTRDKLFWADLFSL